MPPADLTAAAIGIVLAAPIGLVAFFVARRKGRWPVLHGVGTFILAFASPLLGIMAVLIDVVMPAKQVEGTPSRKASQG